MRYWCISNYFHGFFFTLKYNNWLCFIDDVSAEQSSGLDIYYISIRYVFVHFHWNYFKIFVVWLFSNSLNSFLLKNVSRNNYVVLKIKDKMWIKIALSWTIIFHYFCYSIFFCVHVWILYNFYLFSKTYLTIFKVNKYLDVNCIILCTNLK